MKLDDRDGTLGGGRGHLEAVGESYGQHLCVALALGGHLIAAGLACLIHALLPGAFRSTASDSVRNLDERMRARRAPSRG